ncbi:methionine--tRNA ligase [Patescibacteria group bacterium]|nr:methionine--tRNA ligase [Patescibacteria group bacterium]
MKKKFFISTAIDYPSYFPHLGHALEKIQADVLTRYKRSQGFEVHFSIGTDEHGLKMEKSAKKANKDLKEFVDEMSDNFKNLSKVLNISNNDFIRTTEKRHKNVVLKIFKKIYKNGDIYKGRYSGLYCVDCESYYLQKDLVNNKCPIHKKGVEEINEETYFFRMSKYQKKISEHIKKNKNFITPQSRRNEILNRLKDPLQDISISRKTVKWGIPLPIDNSFTLFVWIDALINYLTTIDYPNSRFQDFWPADIHVIGKDIVWHHSIIWGSLLLSVGLSLPKKIFSHGFITIEGEKMSKSLDNAVNPFELVKKYGVDPVRYFLLREFSSTEDGDFNIGRLEERYNSDLANGLGNLVSRVLTLSAKSAVILNDSEESDNGLSKEIKSTQEKYHQAMEEIKFNEALESVWQLIGVCDEYIEKNKPWELAKNNPEKFNSIINDLLVTIKEIANLLEPFMPETSEKILKQIKENKKGETLFPRL